MTNFCHTQPSFHIEKPRQSISLPRKPHTGSSHVWSPDPFPCPKHKDEDEACEWPKYLACRCHAGSQYLNSNDALHLLFGDYFGRVSGLGHFQETWHQGFFQPSLQPPVATVPDGGEPIFWFRGSFLRNRYCDFDLFIHGM